MDAFTRHWPDVRVENVFLVTGNDSTLGTSPKGSLVQESDWKTPPAPIHLKSHDGGRIRKPEIS